MSIMNFDFRKIPGRLIVLCFFSIQATGQIPMIGPEALQDKIKNKTNVADIMKEVEAFYPREKDPYGNPPEGEFENEYVHWKRWEYYARTHAGPNGSFYNVQKAIWDVHEKIISNQIKSFAAQPVSTESFTTPEWTFSGPFSSSYPASPPAGLNGLGRCDRIAFHPTDPATIYVGTPMGGLWKTTNNGSSWTCLTSYLPVAGVSGVVVDWSNPNNIYILTGNGDDQNVTVNPPGRFSSVGVFKSTDAGINWRQVSLPWLANIGPAPYQLKQSPRFANKLLMATSNGLYRSSDYGETWFTIFNVTCYDIDFVPGTDTVWVALSGAFPIKRSPNGGASFANISFGAAPNTPIPLTANRISLAVTNTLLTTNTELVYVFAGPVTGSGTFNGLYKTNNSGFISLARNTPNLFDLSNGGGGGYDQSRYDNCITVKPSNSSMFLTGGAKIFKSIDAGTNIFNSGSYDEPQAGYDLTKYVHGDIHDLAYNPLNNYLYVAGDGGMSYSINDGANWTNISTGLTSSMFYGIAGLEANQYAILSGLQDNGNKYRGTNSSNFIHIGAFDGYYAAISPSNPARGYYSSNQFLIRTDNLGDGTYLGIGPVTAAGQWAWRMNTDLLDGEFLYASPNNTDSLFTSNDGGSTWFRKQFGGAQQAIKNCPSNANRMYTLGGISLATWSLRRTDNIGVSWSSSLLNNPGLPSPVTQFVLDVEVSPLNSNTVFICYSGFDAPNKVFLSTNAGANWVNITYNFPNLPVLTLAVDNSDNVYAGTDYGVFVKLNGATEWYFYANKLPRTTVNDLMINRTNGLLYAATYGRGLWKTSVVTTPCSDDFYYITGSVTGERFYEGRAIWSNAQLDTMQGTKVSFKVTDSIKLLNNFLATDGVQQFRAYTGPCGSSYPLLKTVQDTTRIMLAKLSLPTDEKEGDYPYGTIRISNATDQPEIELDVKKPGNFTVRLSKADGVFLDTMYKLPDAKPGRHTLPLVLSNIAKGLYYVHLLYHDMLVHYQELVIMD